LRWNSRERCHRALVRPIHACGIHGDVDPWGGVGVGYAVLSSTYTLSVADGGATVRATVNGFEFLNLQLGVDYKPTPSLGLGPFVLLSMGQFSNCSDGARPVNCSITNQTLHEWFTIGVRGAYDIAIF
jgi:hypothetical protein